MHNAKLYYFLKCIISNIFLSEYPPTQRKPTNNNNELASILSCCCGNAFFFWATCKIEKFSRVARDRKKKETTAASLRRLGSGVFGGR